MSVTASSYSPGATGVTYTLTYTTATQIPGGAILLFAEFPPEVSLPTVTTIPECVSDGVTVRVNGVQQNISTFLNECLANASLVAMLVHAVLAAGSTVVVTIPDAVNGNPFIAAGFAFFNTATDTANPPPSVQPPAAPVGTPTVSQWAFIALALMIAGLGYWKLRRQYPALT